MDQIRPIPTDFRDHLSELTGNNLKVWLHFYCSTGDDLTSYLSNETIATYTGLSVGTVKACKRRLVAKGWMVYTGDAIQPRDRRGQFDVPVMELRLPWRPEWIVTVGAVAEAYEAVQALHHEEQGIQLAPSHRGAKSVPPSVVQNLPPEGSDSCSGSDLCSGSYSFSVSSTGSCSQLLIPPHGGKAKKQNIKPQTKTNSKTNSKTKTAKDGTSWPHGFDAWRPVHRTIWLDEHDPGSPRFVGNGQIALEPECRSATACDVCGREMDDLSKKPCIQCEPESEAYDAAGLGARTSGVAKPNKKQDRRTDPDEYVCRICGTKDFPYPNLRLCVPCYLDEYRRRRS
jgi:hypothetical protein